MSWTQRRMTRWSLAATLLAVSLTISADSHVTQETPRATQSRPWMPVCAVSQGWAATADGSGWECVAIDDADVIQAVQCAAQADVALQGLRDELTADAVETDTTDVAAEVRSCAPEIAGLTAERDTWRKAAEDADEELHLWQIVGIGGIAVGIVGLLAAVVF